LGVIQELYPNDKHKDKEHNPKRMGRGITPRPYFLPLFTGVRGIRILGR
jgi:hypothetical protein